MAGELAMTNIIAANRAVAMNALVMNKIADGFGLSGFDLEQFGAAHDSIGEASTPAPEAAQLAAGMVPGFLTAMQQTEGQQ